MKKDKKQIVKKILKNFEGMTVSGSLAILKACMQWVIDYAEESKRNGDKNE